MEYTNLIIPFIAGAFALGGAWFGSRSSRLNEHEKWLRQARTEVFARFLRILHECEDHIYADKHAYDGKDRVSFVIHQLNPAYNEARVVKLFLKPEKRRLLFDYLFKIEGGHYSFENLSERHIGIDGIQKLLEDHIDGL